MLTFSYHSRQRILERTSLSCKAIVNSVIKKRYIKIGQDLNESDVFHWLFYSHRDDCCFILIVNEKKFQVITILFAEDFKNWIVDPRLFDCVKKHDYQLKSLRSKSNIKVNNVNCSKNKINLHEKDIKNISFSIYNRQKDKTILMDKNSFIELFIKSVPNANNKSCVIGYDMYFLLHFDFEYYFNIFWTLFAKQVNYNLPLNVQSKTIKQIMKPIFDKDFDMYFSDSLINRITLKLKSFYNEKINLFIDNFSENNYTINSASLLLKTGNLKNAIDTPRCSTIRKHLFYIDYYIVSKNFIYNVIESMHSFSTEAKK